MDNSTYAPRSPNLAGYEYTPQSPNLAATSTYAPQSPNLSGATAVYHPPPGDQWAGPGYAQQGYSNPNQAYGARLAPNVPYSQQSQQYTYQPPTQPYGAASAPYAGYGEPMPQTRGNRVNYKQEDIVDEDYNPGPAVARTPGRRGRPKSEGNGMGMKMEAMPAAPSAAPAHLQKMDTGGIEVKTKFPTARIKRIMQADEDVGKVAQVTPVVMAKALELFMIRLISASATVAKSKGSKRVLANHMKVAVMQDDQFDNLREIVGKVPDAPTSKAEDDDEGSADNAGGTGKKGKKKAGGVGGGRRKRRNSDDES